MNRDDIIRMAQEAEINLLFKGHPEHPERDRNDEIIFTGWVNHRTIRRFAALVAAAEREALKDERRRDMAEIYSLREAEESLREEVERLREALTVAAKAELYDPATGIVDADVLAIVQDTARAALRREEP